LKINQYKLKKTGSGLAFLLTGTAIIITKDPEGDDKGRNESLLGGIDENGPSGGGEGLTSEKRRRCDSQHSH